MMVSTSVEKTFLIEHDGDRADRAHEGVSLTQMAHGFYLLFYLV